MTIVEGDDEIEITVEKAPTKTEARRLQSAGGNQATPVTQSFGQTRGSQQSRCPG